MPKAIAYSSIPVFDTIHIAFEDYGFSALVMAGAVLLRQSISDSIALHRWLCRESSFWYLLILDSWFDKVVSVV